MSASRPISVASIDSDDIYPDYEGFGSINTYSANGTIKTIRMGRCIRAPSIKDLLSVSSMAQKGHECILKANNPRMICKDGTVVPFYFFNNLFYMPYIVPLKSMDSGGSLPTPGHYVDEAQLLSSTIAKDSILGNDEGGSIQPPG